MMPARRPSRRGFTLLELMFSLSITVMIGAAIAAMMAVVSTSMTMKEDDRATLIRANAGMTRLTAYVAPARCVLDATGSDAVIWLNDNRQSDSVHATETRWLRFNSTNGTIDVHFVKFPDGWTQAAKDLADLEYPSVGTDWDAVLTYYQTNGWTDSFSLIDGLNGVSTDTDDPDPLASRNVRFVLDLVTSMDVVPIPIVCTIQLHQPPTL